jgi:hypothetical protein
MTTNQERLTAEYEQELRADMHSEFLLFRTSVVRKLLAEIDALRQERDTLQARIAELEAVLKQYADRGNGNWQQHQGDWIARNEIIDGPSLAQSVLPKEEPKEVQGEKD